MVRLRGHEAADRRRPISPPYCARRGVCAGHCTSRGLAWPDEAEIRPVQGSHVMSLHTLLDVCSISSLRGAPANLSSFPNPAITILAVADTSAIVSVELLLTPYDLLNQDNSPLRSAGFASSLSPPPGGRCRVRRSSPSFSRKWIACSRAAAAGVLRIRCTSTPAATLTLASSGGRLRCTACSLGGAREPRCPARVVSSAESTAGSGVGGVVGGDVASGLFRWTAWRRGGDREFLWAIRVVSRAESTASSGGGAARAGGTASCWPAEAGVGCEAGLALTTRLLASLRPKSVRLTLVEGRMVVGGSGGGRYSTASCSPRRAYIPPAPRCAKHPITRHCMLRTCPPRMHDPGRTCTAIVAWPATHRNRGGGRLAPRAMFRCVTATVVTSAQPYQAPCFQLAGLPLAGTPRGLFHHTTTTSSLTDTYRRTNYSKSARRLHLSLI